MVNRDLPGIFVTAFESIFERLAHGDEVLENYLLESTLSKSFTNSGLLLKGNTKRANLVLILDYIDFLLSDSEFNPEITKGLIYCECDFTFCPNYAYLLYELRMVEELKQWRKHLASLIKQSEYRFFVTGSRDLFIKKEIKEVMAKIYAGGINPKKLVLVVGDAKGVDETATKLWQQAGLRVEIFKAKWDELGKKAGMIRNIEMLESGVDFGYGFCKNNSKGTTGMLKEAQSRSIPFERYDFS